MKHERRLKDVVQMIIQSRASALGAFAGRHRSQRGAAMLLALVFLTIFCMLGLTFAYTSVMQNQTASASSDAVKSRLLSESAVNRTKNLVSSSFKNQLYPGSAFTATTSDSPWSGRVAVTSRGSEDAGMAQAVGTTLGGVEFFPAALPHGDGGWEPVRTTKTVNGREREVIAGRIAYAIVDESGKINPSAVVSADTDAGDESPQDDGGHNRRGASVAELALADAGISAELADKLRPVDGTESGQMPEQGWQTLGHIARTLDLTQAQFENISRAVFPYGKVQEKFWRDADADNEFDDGEQQARLNLNNVGRSQDNAIGVEALYNLFMGSDKAADADDCAWLKEVTNNDWFQDWSPGAAVDKRQAVAAQVAVNMVDYADPDTYPTAAYVDQSGQIQNGSSGESGTYNVHGVERNWGISEVAMRIQTDTVPGDEEDEEDENVDFDIVDDKVVPQEEYKASATVLGASCEWHNGRRVICSAPITVQVDVASTTAEPWGSFTNATAGNVNDGCNPRSHEFGSSFPSGTEITVKSRVWTDRYGFYYYPRFVQWTEYMTVDSANGGRRVTVLRNGDPVPETAGWGDQVDVAHYLQNYAENGHISLTQNQAIYLFDYSRMGTVAEDWQDLVVLVTLSPKDSQSGGSGSGDGEETRQNIVYSEVEHKRGGKAVKFGDASTGLGEDGAHQTDEFVIQVSDADTSVDVTTKAATSEDTVTLNGAGDSASDALGFEIALVSISGATYTFAVESVDNPHALSHVVFEFADGASVVTPGHGSSYSATRYSGSPDTGEGDDSDTPESDAGENLRFRPGFKVEVYYPYAANANETAAPTGVQVGFTVTVETATGKEATADGTMMLSLDEAASADGGTLMYTTDYANAAWTLIEDALDFSASPEENTYTVTQAQINDLVLLDQDENTADALPSTGDSFFFVNWYHDGVVEVEQDDTDDGEGDRTFYARVQAYDPLFNDREEASADFTEFWSVSNGGDNLMLGESADDDVEDGVPDPAGMGELLGEGYQTADYCDAQVSNTAFARLGELGRVHSYRPKRSLRLWSADSDDTSGYDAEIIDLFKIGDETSTTGKVNINTRQEKVLEALLARVSESDPEAAAEAVLAKREENVTFSNIGEFFATVPALYSAEDSSAEASEDDAKEMVVTKLAELITVRQNYFTAIVCAQAIKDVGGIRYDSNGDGELNSEAQFGKIDVEYPGDALRGEFYNNKDFSGLAVEKQDCTVDINVGSGSPHSAVDADTFSIRWTGKVEPRYSETYTFKTISDDGVRLWIDGEKIIDNWTDHAATANTGTISLEADQKYSIKLEYYENRGLSRIELYWSSASQGEEIIPASRLYPDEQAAIVDKVLSESKIMVYLKRNPFTNRVSVLRTKHVME